MKNTLLIILITVFGIHLNSQHNPEALIGSWEFDSENPNLEQLDDQGRQIADAFFSNMGFKFDNKMRVSMSLMDNEMVGFYQLADTTLFMMYSNGEYAQVPYRIADDILYIKLSERQNKILPFGMPLKRINAELPVIEEVIEAEKRLSLEDDDFVGKKLILEQMIKSENMTGEPFKIGAEITHNPDKTRSVNFGDIDYTDRWEYDPGSRTLYWGNDNKGIYLLLIDKNENKLTFRAGANGDKYIFAVE